MRSDFKAGDETDRERTLQMLARLADRAAHAPGEAELFGIEGEAAARYFRQFATMLGEAARGFPEFAFEKRTRRPPADRVNAMLSLGYAERTVSHKPRFGRPALALDMMEPYRPILADSTVLQAVNNGEVKSDGFVAAGYSSRCSSAASRRGGAPRWRAAWNACSMPARTTC